VFFVYGKAASNSFKFIDIRNTIKKLRKRFFNLKEIHKHFFEIYKKKISKSLIKLIY